MRRGEIFLVALDPVMGSEMGKTRPALVLQNDLANRSSPTVTLVPISSKVRRIHPFQVRLDAGEAGLERPGKILCEQIRTVAKSRLLERLGELSRQRLAEVREALEHHLWFGF